MTAEVARVGVLTLQDAVDNLDFAGVEFYAIEGRRKETASAEDEDGWDADVRMDRAYRTVDHGVDYRCQVIVSFPRGEVTVDAAALFRSEQPIDFNRDVVGEFGTSVAIMALYPYIRQAVDDLGSRLGFHTQLPLLRRGQPLPPASDELFPRSSPE